MALTVNSPADFHVHLRQGSFSELITPHVRKGGFDLVYVMVRFAASQEIPVKYSSTSSAKSQTTHHYH